jgi:hypothetical protein
VTFYSQRSKRVRDIDAPSALAEHLAAGRFVAFALRAPATEQTREIAA